MSQYFEDFKIGSEFETRGRTITETDIVMFACLTGDFIELHVNEEYARQSMFGQRIAHGMLVFSISAGLTAQTNLFNDTVLAFYGLDTLRFTKPVFIGDTIRVRKRCLTQQAKDEERGVIGFETTVINQRNEPVIVYHDKLLVKRRRT